ncbi:alpha-amylase family protein [Pontibacter sp. SGAir0037]|uniref:alpha-amylase family protein n=1 Tax=Pontibacter sp. SGAir0037 TaxID=2571030 RepID=UPI0010CD1DAB|nr:alpha-amylase family protein [Pontibacter sp. SGAir0037]QCR21887.1 trehalose synthase [Pontibacter sp. SGAir0037]
MKRQLAATALSFFLIFQATPESLAQKNASSTKRLATPQQVESLWYKNSIIYSVDIDAFKDSDGDGTGDFNGLTQQLDYLQLLGVDVLWLAPFQPSPKLDNGYDISDYYGVNPKLGTPGDFAEFMYQARKRGMRVITDLVLNHTSDQHPWFQEARQNPNSRFRDWYVWSKDRPKDWNKGMVFPGVQEATWSYDEKAGAYYSHRFYKFQPDLNYQNPAVQREAERIIGFWLQQGVDGFRLDAVPFIIEDPRSDREKPIHYFEQISSIRRFTQFRNGNAIILGEANVLPDENQRYFGEEGNGIQMMFNFYVNQHLFYTLASKELKPLKKALEGTRDIPPTAQWGNFLRNHDELDLGRLTEKQRNKVYQEFGPQKNMQLYERGIRRRLAPMLHNRKQLELAYSLMFSLPGTPVIRYGDEIAMGDDLSLKEREAVRTPMQWSAGKHAGFSTSDQPLENPVIDKGEFAYQQVNVEAQLREPGSFLNWTANLIRVRKLCPEIGWGDWQILETGSPYVLAMQYAFKGNHVVLLQNFSETPQQVSFSSGATAKNRLENLLQPETLQADDKGQVKTQVEGYGYRWYRIGGMLPLHDIK